MNIDQSYNDDLLDVDASKDIVPFGHEFLVSTSDIRLEVIRKHNLTRLKERLAVFRN